MPHGFMNPKYAELMGSSKENTNEQGPGKAAGKEAGKRAVSDHLPPHIVIHSHAGGHTVHILHHSGQHEMHEHPRGDVEGLASHVHDHLGTGQAPESVTEDTQAAMGER